MATDDERIAEVAREFCSVEMTRPDHPSGTDRIAEVAARLDCDAVVNVQGDEPLIAPEIDAVAGALSEAEMTTAATPVNNISNYSDANVVKVVVSATGRALYFRGVRFRSCAIYVRESRTAVGGFFVFEALGHLRVPVRGFAAVGGVPPSPLEQAERLELRASENGIGAVRQVEYEAIGWMCRKMCSVWRRC